MRTIGAELHASSEIWCRRITVALIQELHSISIRMIGTQGLDDIGCSSYDSFTTFQLPRFQLRACHPHEFSIRLSC